MSDGTWCWSAEEYFQKRHAKKNEPAVLPVGGLIIFVKSYSCGEDRQAYVLIKIIQRLPWQSMARSLRSQCSGHGFHSWSGNFYPTSCMEQPKIFLLKSYPFNLETHQCLVVLALPHITSFKKHLGFRFKIKIMHIHMYTYALTYKKL